MLTPQKVEEIILSSLQSLNDGFPDDSKITVSPQTVLFGKGSEMDSLSLVSLIVDIEMELNSMLDSEVSLTDDRAMTRAKSPYKNVETLKDYICELLNVQ